MSTVQQAAAVQRLVRESVAHVDALAPEALRAVLPALRQVRAELQADMLDFLSRVKGEDKFSALRRTEALRALESTFDRVAELDPAMGHALAAGRHAAGPLAIANLDTELTRLSAVFGHGVPHLPDINTAAVLAQGNKLLWKRHESSARRYAGDVGNDIKHLLAVGVAKHETIEQMVARLRGLGGGSRRGPFDPGHDAAAIAGGLFQRQRYWADRLVRTEVMNSYNVLHDIATEHANENRPDGEPEYVRKWDATADSVTCPICMGLDGKTAPIGGTFPGGYVRPPIHPHDRCILVAWNPRWSDKGAARVKAESIPPPQPEPIQPDDGPRAVDNRIDEHEPRAIRIGEHRIHADEGEPVAPTREVPARAHVTEEAHMAATQRAIARLAKLVEESQAAERAAAPRGTTSIWQHGDQQRTRQVVHLAEKPRAESFHDEERRKQREHQERVRLMHEGEARRRNPVQPTAADRGPLPKATALPKRRWWPFGR